MCKYINIMELGKYRNNYNNNEKTKVNSHKTNNNSNNNKNIWAGYFCLF